jgi:hypothetical protein
MVMGWGLFGGRVWGWFWGHVRRDGILRFAQDDMRMEEPADKAGRIGGDAGRRHGGCLVVIWGQKALRVRWLGHPSDRTCGRLRLGETGAGIGVVLAHKRAGRSARATGDGIASEEKKRGCQGRAGPSRDADRSVLVVVAARGLAVQAEFFEFAAQGVAMDA